MGVCMILFLFGTVGISVNSVSTSGIVILGMVAASVCYFERQNIGTEII